MPSGGTNHQASGGDRGLSRHRGRSASVRARRRRALASVGEAEPTVSDDEVLIAAMRDAWRWSTSAV